MIKIILLLICLQQVVFPFDCQNFHEQCNSFSFQDKFASTQQDLQESLNKFFDSFLKNRGIMKIDVTPQVDDSLNVNIRATKKIEPTQPIFVFKDLDFISGEKVEQMKDFFIGKLSMDEDKFTKQVRKNMNSLKLPQKTMAALWLLAHISNVNLSVFKNWLRALPHNIDVPLFSFTKNQREKLYEYNPEYHRVLDKTRNEYIILYNEAKPIVEKQFGKEIMEDFFSSEQLKMADFVWALYILDSHGTTEIRFQENAYSVEKIPKTYIFPGPNFIFENKLKENRKLTERDYLIKNIENNYRFIQHNELLFSLQNQHQSQEILQRQIKSRPSFFFVFFGQIKSFLENDCTQIPLYDYNYRAYIKFMEKLSFCEFERTPSHRYLFNYVPFDAYGICYQNNDKKRKELQLIALFMNYDQQQADECFNLIKPVKKQLTPQTLECYNILEQICPKLDKYNIDLRVASFQFIDKIINTVKNILNEVNAESNSSMNTLIKTFLQIRQSELEEVEKFLSQMPWAQSFETKRNQYLNNLNKVDEL